MLLNHKLKVIKLGLLHGLMYAFRPMVTGLPSTRTSVTALPRVLATTRVLPDAEGVGFSRSISMQSLLFLISHGHGGVLSGAPDRRSSGHFFFPFRLDLRYNRPMKKSLLETNPYLRDPAERRRLMRRSLVSSFAIE